MDIADFRFESIECCHVAQQTSGFDISEKIANRVELIGGDRIDIHRDGWSHLSSRSPQLAGILNGRSQFRQVVDFWRPFRVDREKPCLSFPPPRNSQFQDVVRVQTGFVSTNENSFAFGQLQSKVREEFRAAAIDRGGNSDVINELLKGDISRPDKTESSNSCCFSALIEPPRPRLLGRLQLRRGFRIGAAAGFAGWAGVAALSCALSCPAIISEHTDKNHVDLRSKNIWIVLFSCCDNRFPAVGAYQQSLFGSRLRGNVGSAAMQILAPQISIRSKSEITTQTRVLGDADTHFCKKSHPANHHSNLLTAEFAFS